MRSNTQGCTCALYVVCFTGSSRNHLRQNRRGEGGRKTVRTARADYGNGGGCGGGGFGVILEKRPSPCVSEHPGCYTHV